MTIKKIILITLILIVYFFIKVNQQNKVMVTDDTLPTFTLEEIKQFDGSDAEKPIYIVYEGNVYDISSGRDDFYGTGQVYNYLAGKDSTTELNIAGGSIIKNKYKVIGKIK